ncbi:MAG: peptidylprolyl isomerase [Planctomycetota bacterium]|jgi:peptidyl-prolyl cis-trans isomerase B (cyclophilin B)
MKPRPSLVFGVLLPLLTASALCCSGERPADEPPPQATAPAPGEAPSPPPESGKLAVLHTTQGKIKVRFFPKKAPGHVKNFIELAKSGFYDGTYFHRVMPGFMIQGGDPNTKDSNPRNDGLGGHSYMGPGRTLKAEFNNTRHVRGILSMARMQHVDSAGSQFFIMVATNQGLDGKYTAFGKVVQGMEVVDKIVAQPGRPIPGAGGVNPFKKQTIDKITFE